MKTLTLDYKSIIKHELISGSFYIFLGSIISNILAFFLNLFLARSLSYSDYAIFASLLSVITLASIPASSINTIIVKFVTDLFVKKEFDKLKALYFQFAKYIFYISVLILVLFLFLSPIIQSFLHLDSIWYVILAGLVVVSFYVSTLNTAFMQGSFKFGFISLVTILGGILKLISGVILVVLGFKAFGGLWAILIMSLGIFIAGFLPLKKILINNPTSKIKFNTKDFFSYALPAFATVLFMTSFTSMDVILVKHFFSSQSAGFYSGLSLIGKVIFYFTAPIPLVMFPLLIKSRASGTNFNNLFYLSLFLVFLPSITITLFYFLRPAFIINIFLGGREYLRIANYLWIYGLYITIFSLINVFVNFFLSLRVMKVSLLVIGGGISQIFFISLFHKSFLEVITVSIVTSFILLILLFIYFLRERKQLSIAPVIPIQSAV